MSDVLEPVAPFGVSVITSWWHPGRPPLDPVSVSSAVATPPILPSLEATAAAGLPAADFYGGNLGDEVALYLAAGGPRRQEETFREDLLREARRLLVTPGPNQRTALRRVRESFLRIPGSSHVQRGSMRIVAFATHCRAISERRSGWQDAFATGADDDPLTALRRLWPALQRREAGQDEGWRKVERDERKHAGAVPGAVAEPAEACPLAPLLASFRIADAVGARVVEMVAGQRVAEAAPDADQVAWGDAVVARAGWSAFAPGDILVENLFWLATFILTQLPPLDPLTDGEQWLLPPLSMAIEMQHGAVYNVGSPEDYRLLRWRYDKFVHDRMEALRARLKDGTAGPALAAYPALRHHAPPQPLDLRALELAYRLCLSLNVDVGHMLLMDRAAQEISGVGWADGLWAYRERPKKPLKWEAEEKGATLLQALRSVPDLTGQVTHYHLSDHAGAHYADLPPGEISAARDVEPWLRQAYGLAQLTREPTAHVWVDDRAWEDSLQEDDPPENLYRLRPSGPLVHPSLTHHVAIELEACPLPIDRVVSTHATVTRWVRHIATCSDPLSAHAKE